MKKKRFSEEQVVRILREAEAAGQTVAEVCKQQGISEPTWYRWKKRFGQMGVAEVRRLREPAEMQGFASLWGRVAAVGKRRGKKPVW